MSTLTTSQVKSFEREGYLLVHNLLNPEKILDPLVNEYELVLDRLATSLYNKGEISSLFKGLDFSDRMIEIVRESKSCHAQYFDMHLPIKDCKLDFKRPGLGIDPRDIKNIKNKKLLKNVKKDQILNKKLI